MVLSPQAGGDGSEQAEKKRRRRDGGCGADSLQTLQTMLGEGKGQLSSAVDSKISNKLN